MSTNPLPQERCANDSGTHRGSGLCIHCGVTFKDGVPKADECGCPDHKKWMQEITTCIARVEQDQLDLEALVAELRFDAKQFGFETSTIDVSILYRAATRIEALNRENAELKELLAKRQTQKDVWLEKYIEVNTALIAAQGQLQKIREFAERWELEAIDAANMADNEASEALNACSTDILSILDSGVPASQESERA